MGRSKNLQLILLRHGLAGDREEYKALNKGPDSKRPLTAEGIRKLRAITKDIKKIFPNIDAIVSSPYVRALETAQILGKGYPSKK